jgi:hypothetical protein
MPQMISSSDLLDAMTRVAPHVHRTPVMTCATLDRMTGGQLHFKGSMIHCVFQQQLMEKTMCPAAYFPKKMVSVLELPYLASLTTTIRLSAVLIWLWAGKRGKETMHIFRQ